jgi:hypothetical protein
MNIHDLQRIRVELSKEIEPPLVPALIVDEKFIIPVPESGEEQDKYISRCISSIIDEYGQEQASGICYSQWENRGS